MLILIHNVYFLNIMIFLVKYLPIIIYYINNTYTYKLK